MILLPIGHEQGSVRRLPWVTFSVMGICVLAFLWTWKVAPAQVEKAMETLMEARQLFLANPHLELTERETDLLFEGMDPEEREQFITYLRDIYPQPPDELEHEAQQEKLQRLLDKVDSASSLVAFRRFGLIPANQTLTGWLTHMFMHGGWLHLIGNLFMLYLIGPFIEDVWGRGIYSAFYLFAGLAAAMAFIVRQPGLDIPLVGASGAIAGVMGAFLVRYWATNIHFFYMFGFIIHGTFSAPAWIMLPMWFFEQLLLAWATDSMGGGGVAYWAHVGGFAFGVVGAMAMKRFRVEERFIQPAIESQVNRQVVNNEVIDQAMEMRASGKAGEALAVLDTAVRRNPGNRDAALALWAMAIEEGQAARGAAGMVRAIRTQMRGGDTRAALALWLDVMHRVPGIQMDATLLVHLARGLAKENNREGAAATLRLALLQDDSLLTASTALRIAREAVPLDIKVARAAARMALAHPEINGVEKAGAEKLLAELAGAGNGIQLSS